jgi:formylglycine-generating enzyme required for sulfatase activity
MNGINAENPWSNSIGMKFVPVEIAGRTGPDAPLLFSIWATQVRDFARFRSESGYVMATTEPDYRHHDGEGGVSWERTENVSFHLGQEDKPNEPAIGVSWDDANAFCRWLNERDRERPGPGWKYRLAMEAEWGHALWKLNHVLPPGEGGYTALWEFARKREGRTGRAEAGGNGANEFGIYDMTGDIWEWCAGKDETGKTIPVMCGACWFMGNLSWFRRADFWPTFRCDVAGFRVVLSCADDVAA